MIVVTVEIKNCEQTHTPVNIKFANKQPKRGHTYSRTISVAVGIVNMNAKSET